MKKQQVYLLSIELETLPAFLKKKKLAGLKYSFDKFKINEKENFVINKEDFGAAPYRYMDHIASKIAENYYNKNKNHLIDKLIVNSLGEDFIERLIKKEILAKLSRILRDMYLANIFLKQYNLDQINIYNDKIDLEFFNIIKKNLKFNKKIKFSKDLVIKNKFKKFLGKTYFFIKTLFQLEILLFKCLKNWKQEKIQKFNFATRIDNGLSFDDFPYSPEILFNENSKNDVIYYADNNSISAENQKKFRQKKYKLIFFIDDLIKLISFKSFYKKIYKKNFFIKISFLKIIYQNNIFCSILSKSFEQIIFWELFYNLFDVKKNIVLTVDCGVALHYCSKKHNVNTSFVYPHFTEMLYHPFFKGLPVSSDWAYLRFDEINCDKTTKIYLDHLISYEDYNEISFLFKNYVEKSQLSKMNFLNKFSFKDRKNKIIFFYDASVGNKGVMNLNEYKNFLNAINYLLNNSDFIIGLKTKDLRVFEDNREVFELLINLKKHKRFIFLNEINIERYSLLNVPDVIISPPISTIIFEVCCLKKKLLVLNLNKRYKYLKKLMSNDEKVIISVENLKELNQKINILLNKNIENEINQISQKYFLINKNDINNLY